MLQLLTCCLNLTVGTYMTAQLILINPTTFPLIFSALYGAATTSASVTIKVSHAVVPPSSPRLTGIQESCAGGLPLIQW